MQSGSHFLPGKRLMGIRKVNISGDMKKERFQMTRMTGVFLIFAD
jgi:hypothetical protein